MAKPSWLTVNPSSGSGTKTVANSATEHTGRVARTGSVAVQAVGVSESKTYSVTQSPLAEFVSFDEGTSMSAGKESGTVTITGMSNAAKLTISLGAEVTDITLPDTYTANGVSTTNGSNITGDPGA